MNDSVTITIQDRSTERQFRIRRMPALQAEQWMYRAALALGKNVGNLRSSIDDGTNGLMTSILRLDYLDAKPLLDDLLACCHLINGEQFVQLTGANASLIESPLTLVQLRFEAAKLNFDFFSDGTLSSFLARLFTGPSAQK